MSYSKDGKDWLGKDRLEHYDDKGNKVGTSKDGKDWLGNERVEHFDDKGNKVGTSKDGKDWLGNERAEHFDDSGKKTGISKSEKDIFGNDIVQHYDNKGNKTKYTKAEKNWLGQTIFRHRSGGGSGDGLYGIIAVIVIIVLIVVAVLGTFSYPFKIIDPNISPFELDWTSNENVWIFCCSFWILVVLSLLNIKKLFQKNTDNPPNESAKIKQTIILVLITTTLLMVIQYFIKSRFEENYLLISISLNLLIVGALFFINKGSKFKFYLLCISLITSAISLIYINQKTNILVSQNQVESQNISVNNDKDSKELVGNIGVKTDSAASVTNTDVKDLFVFNNISELHSLFNYRDFNHAFVKKGDDYKISLFYVKEAGEDNSGNMYALKIEQQSEIVYVHIFEDNNNKLNILVEPNSGWTDKSQVQLFKTSNNSILIDYNILTNSQKYIKNKIEISYNEIKNKDNVTNSDGDIGDLIGTPIKISNLEVAQHDFPKEMNLEGAKKACSRLGDGWRLPTRDELNILYQNKDKIGGFAGYFYWSSAEISNGDECLQNFNNGRQTVNANEDFYCLIRAVRSF